MDEAIYEVRFQTINYWFRAISTVAVINTRSNNHGIGHLYCFSMLIRIDIALPSKTPHDISTVSLKQTLTKLIMNGTVIKSIYWLSFPTSKTPSCNRSHGFQHWPSDMWTISFSSWAATMPAKGIWQNVITPKIRFMFKFGWFERWHFNQSLFLN